MSLTSSLTIDLLRVRTTEGNINQWESRCLGCRYPISCFPGTAMRPLIIHALSSLLQYYDDAICDYSVLLLLTSRSCLPGFVKVTRSCPTTSSSSWLTDPRCCVVISTLKYLKVLCSDGFISKVNSLWSIICMEYLQWGRDLELHGYGMCLQVDMFTIPCLLT